VSAGNLADAAGTPFAASVPSGHVRRRRRFI
jgi:hypothetical protein